MVEEPAVLVVADDQECRVPLRPSGDCVVDGQDEVLAVGDIRRRVVIVGWYAERVEVAEAGSIQVTAGNRPAAASSKNVGSFASARRLSARFQFRPVLVR